MPHLCSLTAQNLICTSALSFMFMEMRVVILSSWNQLSPCVQLPAHLAGQMESFLNPLDLSHITVLVKSPFENEGKNWKVAEQTICLPHSEQTNQIFYCQLSYSSRLPIGARGDMRHTWQAFMHQTVLCLLLYHPR